MTTRFAGGLTLRTFGAFVGLSFLLTWGLAALLILFPDQLQSLFGELSYTNPLFILAVYAPAIAAILLVWRRSGLRGLGSLFRRLTLWRMPLVWWAFLVFAIPLMFYAGAALKGTLDSPFPFDPWHQVLPALALALFIGPIEEIGWRGLALPLLQRHLAPIWSALLLGAIWALWHVPAFLLSGSPQSNWSFPAFFVGVIAISVIMTPMFNAAGGREGLWAESLSRLEEAGIELPSLEAMSASAGGRSPARPLAGEHLSGSSTRPRPPADCSDRSSCSRFLATVPGAPSSTPHWRCPMSLRP